MEIVGSAALVTGAASGLGAATAAALAERGALVYGLDLERAVSEAGPQPDGVTLLPADVTEEAPVRAALERIDADGAVLRLAVNCAGIAPSARILGRKGPHDLDLFHQVLKVNLLGTFNVLRLAAESIARHEPDENGQRGLVVNTASIAAFEAQIGQIAYAASKGGIIGMTLPAARDLAAIGVRVNTICPGIIDTPIYGSSPDSEEFKARLVAPVVFPKRLGRADEFAHLVLSLIGNDYVNAEVIRFDGGIRFQPK